MQFSFALLVLAGSLVLSANVDVRECIVPTRTAISRVQIINTRVALLDVLTGRFIDLTVHQERVIETVPAIVTSAVCCTRMVLTSRGIQLFQVKAVMMETMYGEVYVFAVGRTVFIPWSTRSDAIGPCPYCGQFHAPAPRVPTSPTLCTYLQV